LTTDASYKVIAEVTEKCLGTPVAALRDMVRNAGDDSARQTSHDPNLEQAKIAGK
jgi:hypothetical protein